MPGPESPEQLTTATTTYLKGAWGGVCHTHMGASYFAMALIATAASSVMAESTVICEE